MWDERLEQRWQQVCAEAVRGMAEWRLHHPKATLSQIEATLDEHLGKVRARMLEDTAMASSTTDLRSISPADCPLCPQCGTRLQHQTWEERSLSTDHGQTIQLQRSYAVCPACGETFFPPR